MKSIAILSILLFLSCENNMIGKLDNPETINGLWSSTTIEAETMTFHTTEGVRGINVDVELTNTKGRWYIWNDGYTDIIDWWEDVEGRHYQ
jgi:hypothetical protein